MAPIPMPRARTSRAATDAATRSWISVVRSYHLCSELMARRLGALGVRTAEIVGRSRDDGNRRSHLVVWRFYWVDGQFIRGDVATKLAGGLARLKGRGDEGAALVLYADEESVAASKAALQAFVQANLGDLNKLLQQTRDAR